MIQCTENVPTTNANLEIKEWLLGDAPQSQHMLLEMLSAAGDKDIYFCFSSVLYISSYNQAWSLKDWYRHEYYFHMSTRTKRSTSGMSEWKCYRDGDSNFKLKATIINRFKLQSAPLKCTSVKRRWKVGPNSVHLTGFNSNVQLES